MSKEVKRYFVDCNWLRGVNEPLDDCDVRVVLASDCDALIAERDRLREALEQIENANWSSSETATDFAISQAKGLLIGKMKRIASAALQGVQP